MTIHCKTNINYFLAVLNLAILLCLSSHIHAKNLQSDSFLNTLTNLQDTLPINRDSTNEIQQLNADIDSVVTNDTIPAKNITLFNNNDSSNHIIIDTLIFSKDSIEAPISYHADDSGVLVIPDKMFMLYGKASVKNNELELDANTILYNQNTHIVKAFGGTDTSLGVLNKPTLIQGDAKSINDTIYFNLKTQKGLTKNTYYNEGEIFVNAERFKKVDKDVGFGYKTTFTTCNLDTPHFDFKARKLKIINNKIAVSGPADFEVEGVPTPLVIPFGIYPLNRGRHSGLLPPQFTANQDFGLGVEGLGYYKVLNDNWDVIVRSNLYSYGGWNLNIQPEYYKRYKYRGNLNLSIQRTKILNSSYTAKTEFTKSMGYFVTWTHATDQKARPGTSFSASVRAGSTKFNQYVPNNSTVNFTNQLNSSISWSRTWNQGKYNISVQGNHDQNNNLGLINIRVPTVNFSATTIYPFQKKEMVGTPKWYEKLGISYTGTALNQFSFYDSIFNFQQLLDTAQWGVEHDIPISLSLPPLGPVIISPMISYSERWYGQKADYSWNEQKLKVDTTTKKGFYAAREISFGISANTRIFGTVLFPKSKGIKAIRHEVKPFISLNYKPDLVSQYYQDVQIDTNHNTYTFSQLDGGVLGSFGQGKFGGISFGIDNLLEMKVRNKKDTAEAATKKIRLIDGLGISSGYNLIVDSFQLSPFSLNLRSTLFEKINITGRAIIDPYAVDTLGRRINKLMWAQNHKIGRFTNGSLAISTSLKSKPRDNKTEQQRIPLDESMTPDEQLAQLQYIRVHAAEFVDFNIPWNVSLSYSLNFYRTISPNLRDYDTRINSNLNVNGDFSLTPKWKIGGSGYYDFNTSKIQSLTLFVTREMHCWQLAINITPVGLFRSFSITLNPKSGILRDLKINRSKFFYNQ